MNYTRNSDPTYYKTHADETNCGSFALRLQEWYSPEDLFIDEVGDIEDWLYNIVYEGYTEEDASEIYSDWLVEQIMQDFDGEIERCDGQPPDTSDKELIAFSTFCMWDADDEWYTCDFHFKVYRDGEWQQKCGHWPVESCELDEWDRYISTPVYFYHYIGE